MRKRIIKLSLLNALLVFSALICTVLLISCSEDAAPSLYDTAYQSRPQPVIDSITPANVALSGVSDITIYGKNFSDVPAENFVFFNGTKVQVTSATNTMLKLKAPDIALDSLYIRVSVHRAILFSERFKYKVEASYTVLYNFKTFEEPYAIATDNSGNVYVSLISNNLGQGIKKITPDGKIENFSPYVAPITKYAALKVGPNGDIYTCNNDQRIIKIDKATGASTNWVTSGMGRVSDLDFDINKNIWAGGNNTNVYRVKQDRSVKSYPFTMNIRAVRVCNGYVYFGGRKDTLETVWRAPLLPGDELGTFEKYFDLYEATGYASNVVYGITMGVDGSMFVATDNTDAILYVSSNKSVKQPLYKGLFKPKALSIANGNGTDLFYTRDKTIGQQLIFRIKAPVEGAPYYGTK